MKNTSLSHPAVPRLTSRLEALPPSGTMAVGLKVRELRDRGLRIVNLSGGMAEPAPTCLKAPIAFAAQRNVAADPAGEPDLRAALATKLLRDQGLAYDGSSEIVVTTGAKQAILPTLLAMLESGDEVLVLDPCWVTYAPVIRLAGGVPVPVSLRRDGAFRLDATAIAAAVTRRTRAIIINSPHNPTGRVFTHEELAGVAGVAADRNLWLFSDESFDKFVFDGNRHVSIAGLEGMRERTVVIQSFSKGFALPGARVGYLAAPAPLCRAVVRFNEHVITCVSPMMQSVALSALVTEAEWTEQLIEHYRLKRQVAATALARMPGIRFTPTEGTFYAFVDVSAHDSSSEAFADRMIQRAGVALTPGIAFGKEAEGHVRMNLVGPVSELVEGLRRMHEELTSPASPG
jgi:aspartate aminotransferase